jgi:hypothetical protein
MYLPKKILQILFNIIRKVEHLVFFPPKGDATHGVSPEPPTVKRISSICGPGIPLSLAFICCLPTLNKPHPLFKIARSSSSR